MIRVTLIAASFALAGCTTLPTEQQLVGRWTTPVDTTQNEFGITQWRSKQLAVMTIRPDHTYTQKHQGESSTVTGHWRLRGRWLFSEFTTRKHGRTATERNRNHIIKLSDQELVFPNDNVWTRSR